MFGIPGYEPNFFENYETFIKVFKASLTKTIGSHLQDYWLMWEIKQNVWYNDGPVILKIDSNQFEFTAYKLDKFSLTLDKIDMTKKLDWYGAGEVIPLAWKNNCNNDLNKLLGRKIIDINLVTYNLFNTVIFDKNNPENTGLKGQTGFMFHGIEFTFEKKHLFDTNNYLQIFNALDSNGISTNALKRDNQFKKVSIKD